MVLVVVLVLLFGGGGEGKQATLDVEQKNGPRGGSGGYSRRPCTAGRPRCAPCGSRAAASGRGRGDGGGQPMIETMGVWVECMIEPSRHHVSIRPFYHQFKFLLP